MAFIPLKIRPGCDVVSSPLLLEAGWSQTLNCRFFQGKIQCQGFFQRLTNLIPRGVCRGLFPWADTSGNEYIAEGTTTELAVITNGVLYDITPVLSTSNLTTPYTTTNTSNVVTITDSADAAIAGNWININTYSAVANLLLQGPYQIQSTGSGTFTINAPIAATSGVTGGVTANFTTTMGSPSVQVTLANHGFGVGSLFTVYVSTSVGGLTLLGLYVVASVTSTSVFHITAPGNATSAASAYENGDQVEIEYLLGSGLVSQGGTAGYGTMPYGEGPYGLGILVNYLPLRQWFFGQWGSDLIASYTGGAIYVWIPSDGISGDPAFNNPATVITNAPPYNTMVFVAMAQQQIICLGSTVATNDTDPLTYTTQDPLLIRWCDVANYTAWAPTTTNEAGSFRLPKGSRIIAGLQIGLQALIWTDIGLWLMQYIGGELVYSFQEVAEGCGLISARAMMVQGNAVAWMSQKGFFLYSGGTLSPIPCPIWDLIFTNINYQQSDKITGAPNSAFNECGWHLPSASGSGENDTIVKVNMNDGSWDYSNGSNAQIYVRTAWVDQSIIGPPMGVDLNSFLQQAETGVSGDGQSIVSSARTGWFKLQNGLDIAFVERIIPDFVIEGNPQLTMSVFTANYPNDTPVQYGPFTAAEVEYFIVRSRTRLAAIQIDCVSPNPSSGTVGAFWRHGETLIKAFPAGRRP